MSKYENYVDITKQIEMLLEKYKLEQGLLVIESLEADTSILTSNGEKSLTDLKKHMDYIFPSLFKNEEEDKLLSNFANNLIGNAIEIPIINSKIALRLNEGIYLLNQQKNKKVKLHVSMLSTDCLHQEDLHI